MSTEHLYLDRHYEDSAMPLYRKVRKIVKDDKVLGIENYSTENGIYAKLTVGICSYIAGGAYASLSAPVCLTYRLYSGGDYSPLWAEQDRGGTYFMHLSNCLGLVPNDLETQDRYAVKKYGKKVMKVLTYRLFSEALRVFNMDKSTFLSETEACSSFAGNKKLGE